MRTRKRATLPQPTDTGNAELLAELYGDKLRYDHAKSRWLLWRKHWWEEAKGGEVMRLAKLAARHRLRRAVKIAGGEQRDAGIRWAQQSEMRPRLEAAIALAQSERPLSDPGMNWDADPCLLGVANGIVDLRTGLLRKGVPSDRITMHTKVAFRSWAKCPRWKSFLVEILVEEELIQFVQRAVGYSLTGETREQCVFLCYGQGANGKSTFLEVLRYTLGEYAHNTPFSTLELKGRTSIPNDVAALVGRRFVTAIETNDSARLNEARLKGLTGSDAVTARYLHREFFTFQPVAKIWLAFNHKPLITDDSHGFWRRINLIPFLQTFAEGKMDKELLGILRAEGPAILAWAVRGCVLWQSDGLRPPPVVRAATQEYREESDPLRDFIEELCILRPSKSVAVGALWVAYRNWVKNNEESWSLDRVAFTRRLEARGLRKIRVGHARTWTWTGICLKPTQRLGVRASDADVRTDADGQIQ